MKIGIDCGHTLSGADYGAVGIRAESKLTREVGTRVINKLQTLGYTVVKCYKDTCSSLNDSLSYRTNMANNNNVDIYISIHFNAFDGSAYGTEILAYGGKNFSEASNVLNNICALGYTNRGIKDGSGLYVLRHTKAKAMLIECCFCDNAEDINKYDAEKIADAIVKGLTGKTTTATTPNTSKNSTNRHTLIDSLYAEMHKQGFSTPPMCRQGAKGEITRMIQKMLLNIGYPVGSYGDGTVAAIKALQRDCNLNPDGIVGRETWKALFRNLK